MSEPLNSAQIILAEGIAERVVAAIREDQAGTPLRPALTTGGFNPDVGAVALRPAPGLHGPHGFA